MCIKRLTITPLYWSTALSIVLLLDCHSKHSWGCAGPKYDVFPKKSYIKQLAAHSCPSWRYLQAEVYAALPVCNAWCLEVKCSLCFCCCKIWRAEKCNLEQPGFLQPQCRALHCCRVVRNLTGRWGWLIPILTISPFRPSMPGGPLRQSWGLPLFPRGP